MSDPQFSINERFQSAIVKAFGAEYANTDPMVRRSDRADYQANVAMGLGKQLKKAPRQVAELIIAKLSVDDLCESVEIAGPGFINLTLRMEYLSEQLRQMSADDRLGVPIAERKDVVVIDYSAPNVAKEMHVGHLRSTIIGDALARVLEFKGHKVIRQNHVGDWGTPFGMLIEHLLDLGEAAGAEELSVGQLAGFYRQARSKFESDPAFSERSRNRVVLLQGGDPQTLRLWKLLVDESKRYFSEVYEKLAVGLRDEDICGESFYNDRLAGVAKDLQDRGLAEVNDGALCMFLDGFLGREGEPLPLIIRKKDGGYGYATTDMTAVAYRTRDLGATRLLYVVGAPQQQHLNMVFEGSKKAGWLGQEVRAEHVAFGSVLGSDGKMFKSREGETVRLIDLLAEAVERAEAAVKEKNPDLPADERADVARKVGIGAIKYSDLSNDRIKDYVFDFGKMLAFEGNTGPYLQYAHARTRSIFRKAEGVVADGTNIDLAAPAERALAMSLLGFATAVAQVDQLLLPHKLCTALYEIADRYMVFYQSCPVMKAPSPEARDSRLALCELCARVLHRGLGLLGIDAPDRM